MTAQPESRQSDCQSCTNLRAENARLQETNEALQAVNKRNGAALLERLLTDRGWMRTPEGNWRAPDEHETP